MQSWPNKIIIVGDTKSGNTMLLKLALERLVGAKSVITLPNELQGNWDDLNVQPQDIIIFVLEDERLAIYRENTFTKWQVVPALARVSKFLKQYPVIPVYVAAARNHFTLQNSGSRYSPPEVLAMLVSGVSGVLEISTALLDDRPVNKLDLRDIKSAWIAQAKFLYGEPAAQLHRFRSFVTSDDWPKEGHDRVTPRELAYAKYSFRVAMALACLSVEEMTIDEGMSNTMENYAQRLGALKLKTGCAMGVEIFTHALGLLDRGWSQRIDVYHKKDRNRMPEWSRSDGFPSVQPILLSPLPEGTYVAELLYDALNQLTFGLNPIDNLQWDPDREGSPIYTTAYFPRRAK